MNKFSGLPYNQYDGKFITNALAQTFGDSDTYTPEQLAYILDFLYPVNYALNHHQLNGGRLTTRVPRQQLKYHAAQDRKWQEQILQDRHPNIVIMKGRQIGMTEMGVAKTLNWVDSYAKYQASAGYFFPTYRQLNDFIKQRFNTVLQDPYFQSIIDKNVNSQAIKKIRDSFITFRTSSKPNSAEGMSNSFACIDEYDRVPEQSIQSIKNSLKGNNIQYLLRFSTPSSPGVGVDQLYSVSDQWNWEYRCSHCNKVQALDYADYVQDKPGEENGSIQLVNKDGINMEAKTVAEGTYRYVCRYCGQPLDRTHGFWMPKYPERTQDDDGIRGYYVSQLNAVWLTASNMKEAELNSESKQRFYNYDLGLPFLDQKMSLTGYDVFDNATRQHPAKNREDYSLVTAGIDWGTQHSVTIVGLKTNGKLDVIANFQIDDVGVTDMASSGSDIRALVAKLTPFDPDMIICDTGDAGNKIRALMHIMGENRVFGCTNNSSPTTGLATASGMLRPVWNIDNNHVKVDKLLEAKREIGLIKEGFIGFYKDRTPDLMRLAKHFGNVIIKTVESSQGVEREVYTRKSASNDGGDHYFSALVLATVGMDKLREDRNDNFDYDFLGSSSGPEQTDLAKQLKQDHVDHDWFK